MGSEDLLNAIQEVSGSIPLISTKTAGNEGEALVSGGFLFCLFPPVSGAAAASCRGTMAFARAG